MNGVDCGGIGCVGHDLPEPWDKTQERRRNRWPCIDKGTPPEEPKPFRPPQQDETELW